MNLQATVSMEYVYEEATVVLCATLKDFLEVHAGDSADVASATNLVSRRKKLLHFNFKK